MSTTRERLSCLLRTRMQLKDGDTKAALATLNTLILHEERSAAQERDLAREAARLNESVIG